MAMDWFRGSKASSVNELIVRKDYPKAIELISELLELSRESLDSIIKTHPRVKEVLEEFHARRADSTVEAAIRGIRRG